MKLILSPDELVPIVRNYLETKMGLTLSGMEFKNDIDFPLAWKPTEGGEIRKLTLEIEVQEAAEKPQAISTPDDPWVNIAHRKPPENSVVVWGKRDACPTYQLGNGDLLIEGFDYWMLVPILS